MSRKLRVAVVGGGPAGVYAADILTKSEVPSVDSVTVDIIDRDPTPFGLIRYGVAPDHPRIKEIIKALKRVMSNPDIRFFGNVNFGTDLKLEDLRQFYDAVIFATGARRDRDLQIPGIDLHGSFGAADFVYWYDGHPDVDRDWDFQPHATQVAVLGVGNVGLDVARILAKTADELLVTEIPDNVHAGLSRNATTDVHVFARRGPAQVKFTPMELRELSHSPNIDVIVHPEGFELDEGSMEALKAAKSQKLVVDVLQNYLAKEPTGAAHRIHIHFCQNPVEILGEDGKVVGLRTEVTELDGTGNVRGTGEFVDWPVQAVYRAIGYYSDNLVGLPFDSVSGVVPNDGGHVIDIDGTPLPGVYATGWIKRGPVGLIGHTKSDAAETVGMLVEDVDDLIAPEHPEREAFDRHLDSRGIAYTTWDGWEKLEAHEQMLGETHAHARERVKVVERDEMVRVSRS
ncbi:pyridine nucleotide-disulfide oxidoreductase [Aeromicrobium marinum DSM 15272]|uniref:ferredoxin--NADP(+) reductase n=1 Tax=Aeromicrobium marinum DSM 15272 TaxID=585531 RepID=E2SFA3_9ACTN|nr:FAD-dependent oxidoreductase [Aeromicrobium marinum]EFQ82188.1 pyridine nucleotide-disulfide oxidoreductase [Aeromicrobium marinum DSM 15272]